CARGGYLFAYW
nr:immunoglobulin heavy chain junction region [Mus musculus]